MNLQQFKNEMANTPVNGPSVILAMKIIREKVDGTMAFPLSCENCILREQHDVCDILVDHCSMNCYKIKKII